jgi:hypothetical protein
MGDIYIVSNRIQFVVFAHIVAGKWNFCCARFLFALCRLCPPQRYELRDSMKFFIVISGVVLQHVLTKCILYIHFMEHTILSAASLCLYSVNVYNLCEITCNTMCILICLNLLFSLLLLNISASVIDTT